VSFRDLARDTSDDEATARVGGALGNIEQWVMPEGFYEAARALPVGGVSEVVETPRGFHIVRRTR
jgi:parvulin-like peptidyl-prolyl isomerase